MVIPLPPFGGGGWTENLMGSGVDRKLLASEDVHRFVNRKKNQILIVLGIDLMVNLMTPGPP